MNETFKEEDLGSFFREAPEVGEIKQCAVVGNSGKVLERRKGGHIDRCDCVVRFNAAPTEGYENHVGTQTDFRVLNGPIMIGGSVDYVTTPKEWISTLEGEKLILMPHRRKRKEKHFNTAKDLAGDKNKIYITKEKIDDYSERVVDNFRISKPSTGLKTVLLFLHVADIVNLFGFGFHQESLDNRHYWEEFSFNSTGGHKWHREKRFMHHLSKKHSVHIR